jgi:hypothetical protein
MFKTMTRQRVYTIPVNMLPKTNQRGRVLSAEVSRWAFGVTFEAKKPVATGIPRNQKPTYAKPGSTSTRLRGQI